MVNSKVIIRKVQESDSEQIVNILNPIIEAGKYTSFDTKFSVQQEEEYIRSFPERGIFLVAELIETKEIIGFHSVEPFSLYFNAFKHVGVFATFVDLKFRSQGIGNLLMENSLNSAKQYGYAKYLGYVREDNKNALEFYSKCGFRTIGRSYNQLKIKEKFIDEIFIEKQII